jgi:competence protein ComEC
MKTPLNSYRILLLLFVIFSGLPIFGQVLKIYQIDVEQGDATLVITPSGKTLLIDCGKNGHGARIKKILDKEGKNKIDVFICTHYHEDHYGGIDDLIKKEGVPVIKAYDRGDKKFLPESKLNDGDYLAYQETLGQDAKTLRRGRVIKLDTDVTITCIASGGVVKSEPSPSPGKDENDMSIAILLTFGSFSYFNGGDIEASTEKKIALYNLVKDVEVCKADHHGSETSSDSGFMAMLSPSILLISNGSDGRYNHPRQKTLNLYEAMKPTPDVYQTNKYLKPNPKGGNVDDKFIADLKSVNKDGTFLVFVDKKSNEYALQYSDAKVTYNIKE